jgi:ferritin-like metal-binding protein YciE
MKQTTGGTLSSKTQENQDLSNKQNDKTTGLKAGTEAGLKNKGQDASSGQKGGVNKKGTAPLEKFFCDALKDIYYAEQKLVTAIPKMEQAATTDELKEAFNDHLHQTQKHVKRLEKVFGLIGKKAEGKKCEAIEGIIKEAETIINETTEGTMTRDAALIIAAQKVEHYEIATYGGLVQLAITMQLNEVADILDTTLMEEEDTDQQLTDIAEAHINMDAEHESANYSWSKEEEANGSNDNNDEEDDDSENDDEDNGDTGDDDEEDNENK